MLLTLPNSDGEVEIGWHLHPDAWGHGYASEAARAVLRRGFEAGLAEINAVTHLGNDRSQAVCRRIGMEHRGVVERWYEEPSEHYLITRERWLQLPDAASTGPPRPSPRGSAPGRRTRPGPAPGPASAAIRAAPGISSSRARETTVGVTVANRWLNTEWPSSWAVTVSTARPSHWSAA